MTKPPCGIFESFVISISRVTSPFRTDPFGRMGSENSETGDFFPIGRVSGGDQKLHEVFCDRRPVVGSKSFHVQGAKHGIFGQFELDSMSMRHFPMRKVNR